MAKDRFYWKCNMLVTFKLTKARDSPDYRETVVFPRKSLPCLVKLVNRA
jgi:hypothetical protein